ncbi:short-chain dehydrogenase/reductase SDR [Desmospora sp. 8437]|nr:short-chain dehydrogenase/reductase SDR [Desmospora sp. 8437]
MEDQSDPGEKIQMADLETSLLSELAYRPRKHYITTLPDKVSITPVLNWKKAWFYYLFLGKQITNS